VNIGGLIGFLRAETPSREENDADSQLTPRKVETAGPGKHHQPQADAIFVFPWTGARK